MRSHSRIAKSVFEDRDLVFQSPSMGRAADESPEVPRPGAAVLPVEGAPSPDPRAGSEPSFADRRTYGAFISYKHGKTTAFAARLESALVAYAKPLLRPPIKIFRDERHLRPGVSLPDLIAEALRDSEFLILLASPGAAGSGWVEDELKIWCTELGRTTNLIFVLTDGEIGVDFEHLCIDWNKTTALPPVLRKSLTSVPLFVDMRWASADDLTLHHPRFKQDVNRISARLRNTDPNDMIGEEVRTFRRNVRLRNGAAVMLAILFLIAVASALLSLQFAHRAAASERAARERADRIQKMSAAADFDQATQYLEQGDKETPRAIALLARALATWPQEWRAEERLKNLLAERVWFRPVGEPMRHRDLVGTASFSPDGKRIVTADYNTARVWDAATGKPLGEPMRHEGSVEAEIFSSDGKRIVTASEDDTVRVWDATTGRPLGEPMRHKDGVLYASFSGDGKRILIESRQGTARVWDAVTGLPIGEPIRQEDSGVVASVSSDGKRIVTAWEEHIARARVWDVATGRPIGKPMPHESFVTAATFSRDGKRIVTAAGVYARVWDATTGLPIGEPIRQEDSVLAASFSSDGKRIVTGAADHTARVWDAATGRQLGEPMRHAGPVSAASFSSDGSRILTESDNAQVWDATTGQLLGELLRHEGGVEAASFSSNGARIVTVSGNNVRVWDASSGLPVGEPTRHGSFGHAASLSSDGTRIVTVSGVDARVQDAATGRLLGEPMRHESFVTAASFSSDGKRIVTASSDHTARVWNAATGRPLTEPIRHPDSVLGASFSLDGKRIVTAGVFARVWDAATGRPLGEAMMQGGRVTAASFSADGKRVVTASEDCTARVWDAATGKPVSEPLKHDCGPYQQGVHTASFSSDGSRIVTAGPDKTARVWEAATGRPLGEPIRHEDYVMAASFSSDGNRILTVSGDTARVWDAATGRPLGELMSHDAAVVAASFSSDGRRIVTASRDGTARVWQQPELSGAFPEWARRWVEAIGSRRFDEHGQLVEAPPFTHIPNPLPPDAPFVRFARWFQQMAASKTVSPMSSRTYHEWVADRLKEGTEKSLEEAYDALPSDPDVLAAMAKRESGSEARKAMVMALTKTKFSPAKPTGAPRKRSSSTP